MAGLHRFIPPGTIRIVCPGAARMFGFAIHRFLAVNTQCRRWYREQSFEMDVLFTLLADAKGAFPNATKSTSGLAKLMRFPVEVRDCKSEGSGLLDFVYLIRASLYLNEVAATEHVL